MFTEDLKAVYRKLRKFYYSYLKAWFVYRETRNWQILDNWATLDYLLEHKCSLSRYGDGEFTVMFGGGNGFQVPDEKLQRRLLEVIKAQDAPNFMVAIPHPMKSYKGLTNPHAFWPEYTSRNIAMLRTLVDKNRLYLNTQVTRFYMEREDKSHCGEHLDRLKQLWDGKDVYIVEGSMTRSGIGNDLYDKANSIHRIVGYSENAFSHYDEMLTAIKRLVPKDALILLCYGMTATVLAYDLAKLGYRAVDIGHLDIEYEWLRMGAFERKLIRGKHVNELKEVGGAEPEPCADPLYLSQIVCDITK